MDGSRAGYLLFELGLLGVHNFVLLVIGVVCYIQLLSISALTGRFNRSLVSCCGRLSSSTEPIGVRMTFSAAVDDDAQGTRVLANPTDFATTELFSQRWTASGRPRAGVGDLCIPNRCLF